MAATPEAVAMVALEEMPVLVPGMPVTVRPVTAVTAAMPEPRVAEPMAVTEATGPTPLPALPQWQAVMGGNPSSFKGVNLPVEHVSWADAQEFIKRVNDSGAMPSGWKFSLPTEAQWEYACRAGEAGPYSGGTIEQVAWYNSNSARRTHDVGTKKANAWGLHDMHGNVWEWCADWYDKTLPGGVDPLGPSSGVLRADRGGSWVSHAAFCRAADRRWDFPDRRRDLLGFRAALVPSK
jgi:formylglycine-generating enzyme required for sulfatase activity